MQRLTFLVFTGLVLAGQAFGKDLSIQRLTWAGVKMVSADTTVLIDAVGQDLWDGDAPEGLFPVTADTGRRYALVTHPHNDHFDVDTLKRVLGERGYVICHESVATYIASRGLRVIPARTYEPVERGGFLFTAVPAEDGFGDVQVSWVIAVDGRRFLHAGDTLWHGQWRKIGRQFGPFDTVFLPVNGARVQTVPPTRTAAVMDPAQAVDAALLLGANTLVPIHFGLNDPPNYVEVANPLLSLEELVSDQDITLRHLRPGEQLRH